MLCGSSLSRVGVSDGTVKLKACWEMSESGKKRKQKLAKIIGAGPESVN